MQRVGPFSSRGGYDWWQLEWHDAGLLSSALREHRDGLLVTAHSIVPVDDAGARLGHPPLHVHHVHAMEGDGEGARVRAATPFSPRLFAEQHGDYQCSDADGSRPHRPTCNRTPPPLLCQEAAQRPPGNDAISLFRNIIVNGSSLIKIKKQTKKWHEI